MKLKTVTLKKVVEIESSRINLLRTMIERREATINDLVNEIKKDLIEIFKLEHPNFIDGAVAEYPVVSQNGDRKVVIKGILSIAPEVSASTAKGYITPYNKDGTLSRNKRIVYEPDKVKVVRKYATR